MTAPKSDVPTPSAAESAPASDKEQAKKPAEETVVHPISVDELRDIEIHGLFSLYRAQTIKEKIFWFVILLAFLCLLIYELVQTVQDYLNQPILTSYSAVAKTSMQFPDVYICPTNFINKTNLNDLDESEKNWLRIFTVLQSKMHPESVLDKISTPWEQIADLLQQDNQEGRNKENGNGRSTKQPTPENVQNFFMNLSYELDEFVKQCSFSGSNIDCHKIVTRILDRDYGVCFLVKVRPRQQTRPGLGLQLVLDVNTGLYSENDTTKLLEGVHIFIEHYFDPTVSEKVLVQPGTYSRISMETKKMKFLNYKKDNIGQNCIKEIQEAPKLEIMKNGNYSPTLCEMDCVQKSSLDTCQCILVVDTQFIRNDPNLLFCDAEKLEKCIFGPDFEKEKKKIKKCNEKCWMLCDAWEYNLYVSSLKFPSKRFSGDANLYKKLQSDYILLNISFDEMQVVDISQRLDISWNTFVGNVGGQLSLWFGMSLLTVVQAIVLLWRCAYYKFHVMRNKKSKSA